MSPFRRRDGHRADAAPARPANLVAIAEARARQRCSVEGQVVRMRARPTEGVPSLAVSIADDTGSVIAIWTGRRAIGGITLGRRLRVEGVGSKVGETLEFTNPAYTLLP
jgi:RecG-like helicase